MARWAASSFTSLARSRMISPVLGSAISAAAQRPTIPPLPPRMVLSLLLGGGGPPRPPPGADDTLAQGFEQTFLGRLTDPDAGGRPAVLFDDDNVLGNID